LPGEITKEGVDGPLLHVSNMLSGIAEQKQRSHKMDITHDAYPQIRRLTCAAARRIGGFDAQDGDDLTQDVILKLWRFRDRIRSAECLSVIAYRTAARTWLNMCRSRSTRRARLSLYREQLLAAGESTCEEPDDWPAAEIWVRVAELNSRISEAIRRHFIDGESYLLIGRSMGVSKSTVYNLVQDGLRQLRAKLSDANEQDEPPRGGRRCEKDFSRSPLAISARRDIQTSIAAKRAAGPYKERGQSCPA
jgi:RNA polymerase sigma factor (sigma-70 family)